MRLTAIAAFISATLASMIIATPALAVPTLPSSFYGNVLYNGANVPDGTLVQALIGEQVFAEAYTQVQQGVSMYSLDVRGDDTDTTQKDGGQEGDIIQFKIGGLLAAETGTWHGGTVANLNLSVTSSSPLSGPQATPTQPATQTAILAASASPKSQSTARPTVAQSSGRPAATSFNPGALVPRSQTVGPTSAGGGAAVIASTPLATQMGNGRSERTPGAWVPATPSAGGSNPGPNTGLAWLGGLGAIVAVGIAGWFYFKKK